MLSTLRRRLSFANVIACVALFIALGGTSVAQDSARSALRLITGKQVQNSSLTGADIRDRSLTAKDFRAGQLPSGQDGVAGLPGETGPVGPQGTTGPQGIAGPKGDTGTVGPRGEAGATGPKGDRGDNYAAGPGLNLDGTVFSARFGTTAGTIAGGDDPRFTDARTPTGTAGGDLQGTYPSPTLGPDAVTSAKVADASLRIADFAAPNASNAPLTGTVVLDPGNVVAGTCSFESTSLNGVQAADIVLGQFGTSMADALIAEPVRPSPDALRFRVCNTSGSDIDDGASTFRFIVLR